MSKQFKSMGLIFLLVLCFVLVGCDKDKLFNMQKIKTFKVTGYSAEALGTFTIDSKSTLINFSVGLKNKLDLTSDYIKSETSTSYESAIEKYDSQFFESHFLVLNIRESNTMSTNYEFNSYKLAGDKLTIKITKIMPAEDSPMNCFWILICEVPNKYLNKTVDMEVD